MNEQDGVWGTAIKVPGTATVNGGVNSVSCGGPRDCAAVGPYADFRTFVASEHGGVWGEARFKPGIFLSISCGGVGSCVAVGYAPGRRHHVHGFVMVETNGKWGKGTRVPGMWTLSGRGRSEVRGVSCASPGNCAAVGVYHSRGSHHSFVEGSVFVVEERHGKWSKAMAVPGITNASGIFISCTSAGNCAIGGDYTEDGRFGKQWAFVAAERKGTWGKAIRVPGLAALGAEGREVTSVSCASAGNCAAVGDAQGLVFAVAERNGVWGRAISVTTLGDLGSQATSVSCARAGNCAIGGTYGVTAGGGHAFVTAP